MKSPKLKIITAAVFFALANLAHANEVQPYTLSIKYIDSSVEALVLVKDGVNYISKPDMTKAYALAVKDAPTITFEDEEYIPVSYLGNLEVEEKSMTAFLELKAAFMPEQRYSLDRARFSTPSDPEAGQYLNYDFYHDINAKHSSLDLSHRFSTKKGNFGEFSGNFNSDRGFSLLDASYSKRIVDKNQVLKFGTSTSSYNEVANSFRFLGVQLKSDRTLDASNDERVSSAFTGTAEVQGTAELFLNGNKILRQDIRPGDFTFDGLHNPMTTSGEAVLVIRDVNGRLVSYSTPLLGSPRNLREGYSTYSFETGYLRTDYNSLGDLFASGDYAYGLNDRITLSGHMEVTKGIQNIAASATVATDLGTFKGGASVGKGTIYNLGYYLSNKYAYANVDYKRHINQQGIASDSRKNSDTLTFNGSLRVTDKHSLNLSALKTGTEKYYSVGSSLLLDRGMSIQGTLSRDSIVGTKFFVGLNFAMGGVQSNNYYDSNQKSYTSEIRRNNYDLNQLDYSARYNRFRNSNIFNGSVTMPTQYGDFGADLSVSDDKAVRVRASGSVLKAGDDIMFGRKIDDAYVIIDTKAPNISINTSSGYRGKTNQNGKLVYPSASLGEHKIFLNNKDFPDDMMPMEDDIRVNPYPKSAKTVEIKILKEGFNLVLDTEKESIKIGDRKFFKVGGEFYIDGLSDGAHEFTVDGIRYSFNTKEIDAIGTLKAKKI